MSLGFERETLVEARGPLRPGSLHEVIHLAAPAMAAAVSTFLMSLVDTIMVAGTGEGAVGAVTSSMMWLHVVTTALGGLMSAIATFASQSYSRGRMDEAVRYTWQGIFLGAVVGVAALGLEPALPALFRWLGHPPVIQSLEVAYTQYRLMSLPPLMAGWALITFFQGIGRTKLVMVVVVAGNVTNAVFNWLFIFGVGPFPEMGVAGAGLGTVIATAMGFVWLGWVFLFGRHRGPGMVRWAGLSWMRIKGLARVGLPTSMQVSLDVAVWAIWHTWLVGQLGGAALDANGAVNQIVQMCWMPVLGINQAACALAGWYLGRGDRVTTRRAVNNSLKLAVGYMAIMGVVLFVGARWLMESFFVLQEGQGGGAGELAEVIAIGVTALHIAALFQIFDGINITLIGALKGGGDTLWPAIVQHAIAWPCFLPLAWFLCIGIGWGVAGAWIAAAIYLTVLSGVLGLRYRGDAWMRKDIFRDRADMAPADAAT